ncbi:MAG: type IV toxin-antitoxin system AbiEi family antitoxin domain-containing protein [Micrococcales bacterium]|nr:type IV toxin-antitoxin system AbiEi family antitoxin domain-containing protein [Micrococcales bacterium]
MKTTDALSVLSDLTASQWAMVTTAQAATCGITRLQLSRLADQGHLERIGQGIYRNAGAPTGRFDAVKAAWLSISPKLTAEKRLTSKPADAVASGATAAYLLGLGDLVPEPYQFTVPKRRQTQRHELVFRVRQLPAEASTRREGLPITTPEQTIADLLEERMDKSLVADVFADVTSIDAGRMVALLSPLAARYGFRSGDGQAFYAQLQRLARRDMESLAKAVVATPLAGKILDEYAKTVDPAVLKAVTATAQSTAVALASSTVLKQLIESQQALTLTIAPALSKIARAVSQMKPVMTPEAMASIKSIQESLARVPMPRIELDSRRRRQLMEASGRMKPPLAVARTATSSSKSDKESETS